jgi:hemoglobin
MRSDIKDRNGVSLLVRDFYGKVRNDDFIGPVFNSIITDWENHLEKLTDFWNMNLFGGKAYNGNPITAHQDADAQSDYDITPSHFGAWLNLWFESIDKNYEGEKAEILKRRARKMQTVLMVAIFENRRSSID